MSQTGWSEGNYKYVMPDKQLEISDKILQAIEVKTSGVWTFERRFAAQPIKLMPPEAAEIGDSGLSFDVRNGRFHYWHYSLPYGFHEEDDIGGEEPGNRGVRQGGRPPCRSRRGVRCQPAACMSSSGPSSKSRMGECPRSPEETRSVGDSRGVESRRGAAAGGRREHPAGRVRLRSRLRDFALELAQGIDRGAGGFGRCDRSIGNSRRRECRRGSRRSA